MTTTDLTNERLQDLVDRADIYDCMLRYARGMDRRDRALVRSAYHDDAIDEHVGFVGPVDDFIDWAFAYHRTQTRYQHYLQNHRADLDGDSAHSETYYLFIGTDREPHDHLTISGGRYVDRLERREGRWGIVARSCVVEWQTESTNLMSEGVMDMLAGLQTVAHDHSDTSYERPLLLRRAERV
ncbi:nuclear transport factor 2 family protein [soil metagenome]